MLKDNSIEDQGAEYLAQALEINTVRWFLWLSSLYIIVFFFFAIDIKNIESCKELYSNIRSRIFSQSITQKSSKNIIFHLISMKFNS